MSKRKIHICDKAETPYYGILREVGFHDEQAQKSDWTENDIADIKYREARENGELDYIFG